MDLDYLVVADAAVASGGKHYIHGAGWDMLWASSFPIQHPLLAVAVRLRVPWHDTNQPHAVEVDVVDADGRSILPAPPGPLTGTMTTGRPPHLAAGSDQVAVLTFNIAGLQFSGPGMFAVVFRLDGQEVGRSPFTVGVLTQQQAMLGPAAA